MDTTPTRGGTEKPKRYKAPSMSERIPESELILNPDGSIYHLNLKPDQIGEIIFSVGDPDRVAQVSRYFDVIDFKGKKREFVTHTGRIGDHRVSAMSTGMGTDNIEIFMTEIDALVNVDLENRKVKHNHRSLKIIRLGTSGALDPEIPVGSLLASETAIGLDTLMQFYPPLEGNQEWAYALKEGLSLGFLPYQAEGSKLLLEKTQSQFLRGITLTAPGFYAPQGREVRLSPRINGMFEKLAILIINGKRLTNFEMETAGYYAMAKLLGHEVLSLNAIIANRPLKTFDSEPEKTVDRMIRLAIESFL